MNLNPLNTETLQNDASQAINYLSHYYENVHKYPVRSEVEPVGFNWIASPAATELEAIVLDWMGKLLNLPQQFLFSSGGGGVMHGSTCEAVVCTLAAARDRALDTHGEEKITKLVVYASDQTHFTFQKSAKLVGISPRNFRVLPTYSSRDFGLSPTKLTETIEADISQGLVPLYVCASVGATGSGAVDPIDGLGRIAKEFGAWLHVDAAFAGSACICPEYRHYLNGVEFADSISMNPHKWLLTNMDCTCLWLRNPKLLVDSLSTNSEILRNKASDLNEVIDYKDWQIALSRRFRALKL
uniref:Tyrosine decarboxylase n=1 Tax=Chenopodium quinoa TaxID=63459 RepID=A0A803MR18_CHEQI